jgi:hypothetical protein
MGFFEKLGFTGTLKESIDWDMNPMDTFGIFESWGGKDRIRSKKERVYYFFIDSWEEPASLCLMERGIKHAKVLARIMAPQELIDQCLAEQGKAKGYEKAFAVNSNLREWIIKNVLDTDDESRFKIIDDDEDAAIIPTGLPGPDADCSLPRIALKSEQGFIQEEEISDLLKKHNFFESQHKPDGRFENFLVDNGDDLTVTDKVTGIMWQRAGSDLASYRMLQGWMDDLNKAALAGYSDWRFPTLEEAMSLMENQKNTFGLYMHPCFGKEQPFIFVSDRRKPGGYWFVDYKQGTVYWASGTIPGGFCRLCRKAG